VPGSASQAISAVEAIQDIVAGSAVDAVDPVVAADLVVPEATLKHLNSPASDEDIVPLRRTHSFDRADAVVAFAGRRSGRQVDPERLDPAAHLELVWSGSTGYDIVAVRGHDPVGATTGVDAIVAMAAFDAIRHVAATDHVFAVVPIEPGAPERSQYVAAATPAGRRVDQLLLGPILMRS
jgi:hypothetical protein